MFRPRNRAVGAALLMVIILVLTACSSTGGKKAAEAGSNVVAGHASTPHYTIAMITHAGPGQSFWDIERYGGVAAATKDNFTLKYSANPDPTQQAQLITDAINSHVNGIAVTDPDPQALCPTIQKARAAGIPVTMFNAGSAAAAARRGMYSGASPQPDEACACGLVSARGRAVAAGAPAGAQGSSQCDCSFAACSGRVAVAGRASSRSPL